MHYAHEGLEKIGKRFNRMPEQVEAAAFDLLKKSQKGILYTGDKFSDEVLRLLIELKAVEQEHELAKFKTTEEGMFYIKRKWILKDYRSIRTERIYEWIIKMLTLLFAGIGAVAAVWSLFR